MNRIRRNKFQKWIFAFVVSLVFISILINIYICSQLQFFVPFFESEIISNSSSYTSDRYFIDPESPKSSITDNPHWPPIKVFVYPEEKTHTEECLYPSKHPNTYVNESDYWFQRMLEPTIHHQFLNLKLKLHHFHKK